MFAKIEHQTTAKKHAVVPNSQGVRSAHRRSNRLQQLSTADNIQLRESNRSLQLHIVGVRLSNTWVNNSNAIRHEMKINFNTPIINLCIDQANSSSYRVRIELEVMCATLTQSDTHTHFMCTRICRIIDVYFFFSAFIRACSNTHTHTNARQRARAAARTRLPAETEKKRSLYAHEIFTQTYNHTC